MFPKKVRERLIQENEERRKMEENGGRTSSGNYRLKSFLSTGNNDSGITGAAPIADLFPETTVFFSDIAGFTAWSSTREPVQVFILLQNLYQAFDQIAKRRKVFKVETIGDAVSF
jgi:class 3 adenylate cyclase